MILALPGQALSTEKKGANRQYHDLMWLLDNEGKVISYADLLTIYNTITTTENHIPHIDEVLSRLLAERNEHPRVDQMILIITAKLIGTSKQEIPNVSVLLKALILDTRTNLWTAGFAAEALGSYYIDLEDGELLADMVDGKIDSLIEKERGTPAEFYGYHFLPPPTTEYIQNIISHPKEQKRRESTRLYYYALRMQYSEDQIKEYLLFLDKHGQIDTKEKIDFTMKYLFDNIELTQAAFSKEKMSKLSSGTPQGQQ